MSINSKGLGRGLDALFLNNPQDTVKTDNASQDSPFIMVSTDALVPNPAQPRTNFQEDGLGELTSSIRIHGILQPLLVRPLPEPGHYQIIAGERRWRAARQAGISSIPVIVRPMDDNEAFVTALIENIQRENLNPIEYANAVSTLLQTMNMTHEQLSEKLGVARSVISNMVRLLHLDDAAQKDLINGNLTSAHARYLLAVPQGVTAEKLRLQILDKGMTVRETEYAVNFWKENNYFPWEKEDGQAEARKRDSKQKDPDIMRLANQIGATLNCKTRINGDSEKGKISLTYETNAQLFDLLEKLGLSLTT